jgi:hypothetical protein
MRAVLVVLLLGLGLTALGLLAPDMYAVGAVVVFIGAIGFLVCVPELWHRLVRRLRPRHE